MFSVVNYSQLCSFRPMHTQFPSILHDFKSFDYVKKQFCCLHRIVVGLKFKLPTRQNNENEKLHIFLDSHRENFKIVCRNKVLVVFKDVQNLFFTPKFLLSFFRHVFSLTSCSISWKIVLQEEFCPFSCFLWWTIPNCVHLDPSTLNFDQFYMTWNHLTTTKKHFYCFHQIVPGLQFQPLTRRNKGKKNLLPFSDSQVKASKLCAETLLLCHFKKVQNWFFTPNCLISYFKTDAFCLTPSTFSSKDVLQKEVCHFTKRSLLFSVWNIPNFVHWSPWPGTFNFCHIFMTWNHWLRQKTY